MSSPSELSIEEIRKFMLDNSCKVTNHALVKHFKHFLTHPQIQNEARKQFKIYVNILATIKNENGQKYLILRKKYINECPPSDVIERAMSADALGASPSSPGGTSIISESSLTSPAPFRQPPPYKPPPDVTPNALNTSATLPVVIAGTTVNQENIENYRDCVNEFEDAVRLIDPTRLERQHSEENENELSEKTAEKENAEVQLRDKNVSDAADEKMQNQEKIPRFSFSSGNSATSTDGSTAEKVSSSEGDVNENSISVKEAMRKFNRIASEEEAKTNSPVGKKIPEKQLIENKIVPEVTMAHPKAKEWLVSMAKANYQELAKLANEYPELVKLQDPALGYTALHWAAKHGNEDVIKLIAGTYKADVNARTNGGYTPLHLAMQFGRVNIFELLCNVYKANRDLTDWSGNKPLDYSKQCTSVSALTYSKIQTMRQQLLNSGYGTWRNQSKEKTYSRKRFGLPTDWFFECPSEEDNRSIQQLLGSGQWQWELDADTSDYCKDCKSSSLQVSPTPSSSGSWSSSSSRWYDAQSSPSETDDERDDEPTICSEQSS